MKWDCDARWKRKCNWHRWFAWHPVQVAPSDCRWLEVIERKYVIHMYDWWEYRALETPRDVPNMPD